MELFPYCKAVIVDDESTDIRKNSASENTVITAVILVMIYCSCYLGIRSGLIVGLSIPTTYLFQY